MKRFYDEVTIACEPPGYQVLLDGRPIRSQSGAPQIVPTTALAEAMAGEWRDQPGTIDPHALPLRDLADYAIDQVAPDRGAAITKLLGFAETDTLCYRADPDMPLYQRQLEVWEPLLATCEARHGFRLERTSSVLHRPQPPVAIAALRQTLETMDDFALAGLAALASLAASLTIALAALDASADPYALFGAANLEQDWQAGQWGWDLDAERTRDAHARAFSQAARFIRLLRAPSA